MATAALLALFMSACAPGPEAFHFGEDIGAHCRMPIVDARFAAQVVLETGKVVKFDSIECTIGWLETKDLATVHSVWVSDAIGSGALIAANDAVFAQDEAIRSPMGGGLAAFVSVEAARKALESPDVQVLSWTDVLNHRQGA